MIATIVFTLCRCGVKKLVKLQYWNLTHRKFPGEFYTLMFFDTVCLKYSLWSSSRNFSVSEK